MKLAPALAAVGLGLLALAGCGGSSGYGGGGQLSATGYAVQDSTASDALMAQSLDAANAALVVHATGTTTDPATTSLPVAVARGGMASVDLARLPAIDFVANFSDLKDANSNSRFPDCSGSIHIQTSGEVVPSWPTGSGALAVFTVTVLFDQGPVTYTDPHSNAVVTISSGSYTYQLQSSYTHTSDRNWVLILESTHIIASGSPLTATVTRTGKPAHTVSLFGARDAHVTLTRVDDGGATNTYTVDGTVNGLNPDGSHVDGVNSVDGGNPTLTFTNWDFTINNGSTHVVWNRNAHLKYHWDFVAGAVLTIDQSSEEIFITIDGTKYGPYTSAQLIALFHATPK
jgi:hypothetical protein